MLRPELAEAALALGAALPLAEPPERARQRAALHLAISLEVHARLTAQPGELHLLFRLEPVQVGDGVQVDVDRLQRTGARRGIGAVLPGRDLVQGQQLPERAADVSSHSATRPASA